jgi:PIN domain nuclease of toxin-antitoxin system
MRRSSSPCPTTNWSAGADETAAQAGLWAVPHRDPVDRLLAAQARSEDLVLASTDPAFTQFEGVVTLG